MTFFLTFKGGGKMVKKKKQPCSLMEVLTGIATLMEVLTTTTKDPQKELSGPPNNHHHHPPNHLNHHCPQECRPG